MLTHIQYCILTSKYYCEAKVKVLSDSTLSILNSFILVEFFLKVRGLDSIKQRYQIHKHLAFSVEEKRKETN
jgi:hypothetical protein